MDGIRQRVTELAQRYKYVLLVVLAGVFLMMVPTASTKAETQPAEVQSAGPDTDAQLEQILSQIAGVGKVQVLLTISRGEQTLYIYDEDYNEGADSRTGRKEAVVVTGQDRAQSGLISQVIGPEYLGAVVVCQGGDKAEVRLQVVEAVCDATGLTADKVTVLKMK